MESMWNGFIPWNPHGIHMEYVSSPNDIFINMDSIWIPHGVHVHSTWTIPYGFHMEYVSPLNPVLYSPLDVPSGMRLYQRISPKSNLDSMDSTQNPYGMNT